MAPGGNQNATGTGREEALAALRAEWGKSYDIGTATVAGKDHPIVLWVAVRLEAQKPEPLTGLTAEALEAAIRDDWVWEP